MKILLIIGAGSFIGGVLRYMLTLSVHSRIVSVFPYGTLAVNLVGCFVIGILFALAEKANLSSEWRLFFATGICGGFTTFSAFSLETFGLLRDGQIGYASVYVITSVILGVFATFIGYSLFKLF